MNSNTCKTVLATANAKYAHSAFALKYLIANLGRHKKDACIIEFTTKERPIDVAERIIFLHPEIVALSVYIWNVDFLTDVALLLKQIEPEIVIITGGPEVSFKHDPSPISKIADCTISGEGESVLPGLIDDITQKKEIPSYINGGYIDLKSVILPYDLYTEHEIAHKVLYVEASRGCAFGCEFCLSSLDKKVRYFDIKKLITAFDDLWQRGARRFKFIDRTIHLSKLKDIILFFLKKSKLDNTLFIHFEIVPDSISKELIELLAQFPKGAVQLEAGVQTFNNEVAKNINRKQNIEKTVTNIKKLLDTTGVHLHSDLVAGLPGETIESFAAGFDKLMATGVHEIQVGILKLLKGAPIIRHNDNFKMVYSKKPPYDILKNCDLCFKDMQRIKRFSRYFDMVVNNGYFKKTSLYIWKNRSPFYGFMDFSDWLFKETSQTSSIALIRLAELLFKYLTDIKSFDKEEVANSTIYDFKQSGQKRVPRVIKEAASINLKTVEHLQSHEHLFKRQQRHLKEDNL